MRIQTNTSALKAKNSFTKVNAELGKALEKLSSGYSINRAADNAAGLAVSEKMRYMITGLEQGELNIRDGSSYVQVAEGALFEIEDMLNRSKELTEQAMNGTYTYDERKAINDEIDQIKSEIDRIITSASFNGLSIWGKDNASFTQIGTKMVQAVTFTTDKSKFKITDDNKGYIPVSPGFNVVADKEKGITISWEGYDGKQYTTKDIPWPTPANSSYSFKIGPNCDPVLDDFDFPISYTVNEYASLDDVINSLNGVSLYVSVPTSHPVTTDGGVSFTSNINYDSQWTSEKYMEQYDNQFIQFSRFEKTPNITAGTGSWDIRFNMNNVGEVQAVSGSVSYYSNDGSASSQGIWWDYIDDEPDKDTLGYIPTNSSSSLEGILNSFDNGTDTKPCLSEINNGTIVVNFSLNKVGGESIGNMTMYVHVGQNDTIDTIKSRLARMTSVNISNGDGTSANNYEATLYTSTNYNPIENPILKAIYDVTIQGGLETNEQIHITYDQLSLDFIGMSDVDVLSQEESVKTFDAITEALSIVTKQHGVFGSYTNRLEHASNSNLNRFENLQASESRIRDTDMAKTMMKYTAKNILSQAAQTLLAQANTRPEMVLQMMN